MRSTDYSQVFAKPDLFPLLYDAHHNRRLEDIPFWLELARRTGGRVLELGCGTGRVLLPLAASGVEAFGLERDSGMLARLKKLLPANRRSHVHLLQADMAALPLKSSFDLILLPCNTFSTLRPPERMDVLEGVKACLSPKGRFALSLPNPAVLRSLPLESESEVEEEFPHSLTGNPVQVSSAWRRTEAEFILSWHYDHLLPDGRVERLTVEQPHTLTSAEEYRVEFTRQGLQAVEVYGDFDRSAYRRSSPYLIFVLAHGRF